MQGVQQVDTTFDLRDEVGGRDPDTYSPTLRAYHQLLWSKPLPSGASFALDVRLRHESELGFFRLSSDTIAATYTRWMGPTRVREVIKAVPVEDVAAFNRVASTVGALLVFPLPARSGAARAQSINQARGIHHAIRDRFDLTLECIRRQYLGLSSPLEEVLGRHRDFFDLFGDFQGYVDHFLLNDLVDSDYRAVRCSRRLMTSPVIRCPAAPPRSTGPTCTVQWPSSKLGSARIQRSARSQVHTPLAV